MNVTTRFAEEFVSLAESYSDDAGEPAAPEGGGRFAEYAMISLHGMRIFLGKSYEMSLDILATMTPILGGIGLEPADFPDPSTLYNWFDRITIDVWRMLLRHSAQLHNASDHVVVDATYYDRSSASKHYCQRTNYRV